MEHVIYLAILLLLTIAALLVWRKERRIAEQARRERDEMEFEERRMFDFLHGLGESIQADSSRANLHSYIVDGIARVVGADAAVLYHYDAQRNRLRPLYQTKTPVLLVPLPDEILDLPEGKDPVPHLRTYARLTTFAPGETFIGCCFEEGRQIFAENICRHPLFVGRENSFQSGVSLIASPLIYAKKKIGVLAVTRSDRPFVQNDREVFASVSEQSSFALGSALAHNAMEEKRELERELKQASEIQQVLLPREAPSLSDYHVAATYRAARIVSGDYYDYIAIDRDHYGIAIGDVSGKGIAASLIVAMCRSLLRSNAVGRLLPAQVLHAVNESIFTDIKRDMFVSLLYLVLSRHSSQITLAGAGQEPPILCRCKTGSVEFIETMGMAAGVDSGEVFTRSVRDQDIAMEKGDLLVLYTDGIIEARNANDEEFGLARLTDHVRHCAGSGAEDTVKYIEKQVAQFSGGVPRSDDITLIAIEKR